MSQMMRMMKMYNNNRSYIFKNLYKDIYIAKKLDPIEDENHNEFAQYDTPVKYKRWNIQYIKSNSEILEFGEKANITQVTTIPNTPQYAGKFKEFDLAYLDGATPDGEKVNGQNANYRIYSVRPQNNIIRIYFRKLTK